MCAVPMTGMFLIVAALLSSQVSFTTLSRGQQSGIEQPREVVVRDEAALKALWQAHAPGDAPPRVDFRTSMVVGIFTGQHSTAGHAVEIVALERAADAVVVVYRREAPGEGDVSAQVITFPHHIVRVPRHEGPVRFRQEGSKPKA
jgi:hypothetical protein